MRRLPGAVVVVGQVPPLTASGRAVAQLRSGVPRRTRACRGRRTAYAALQLPAAPDAWR